ncbi:MAG: hypothetical protein ACI3XQ_13390 [Eubacteriales bacterium]
MTILYFDVFIGCCNNPTIAETIVAKVYPQFIIPHGEVDESGEPMQTHNLCFKRLEALGTYFADWLDIVQDNKKIKAKIHLNTNSFFKTFQGEQIVKIIDKIDSLGDYSKVKSFDNLL